MSASLHETFIANVRRRLIELDLNQRGFAVLMGVSEATVSQLLAGKNVPTLTAVEKVAAYLKTNRLYLLTEAGADESEKVPELSESGVDAA